MTETIKPNDGGPAFPCRFDEADRSLTVEAYPGMSLRQWYAGMAIGPLMASDGFEKQIMRDKNFDFETMLPKFAAREAFLIADAMVEESNKQKTDVQPTKERK